MREIKFRIFVKESKEMIYGRRAMAVKMFTPNYSYLNSEVEVMQFTGIKDKNDKEIYEGDIVKFHSLYEKNGKIVFLDGAFMIDDFYDKEYLNAFDKECEVVGNIFENPSLLSEEVVAI